ncbi:hypothetical protein PPYR_03991 [Photinus pyralis]|uniref:Uncharacterized protein n=1 Tax=Photinus pyralis TaxID=7054 RepID=A0A5N4AWS1_PHOPY|nr:hypothetical protein PPYR_03991 [Photinus pyralis]
MCTCADCPYLLIYYIEIVTDASSNDKHITYCNNHKYVTCTTLFAVLSKKQLFVKELLIKRSFHRCGWTDSRLFIDITAKTVVQVKMLNDSFTPAEISRIVYILSL